MHNSYNQVMYEDLQLFLDIPRKEFVKTELQILEMLNFSTCLRGGVLLRAVDHALAHYGEVSLVHMGDRLFLKTIGEKITEQILVEKRLLARKSCELVSSICLCSIALFNRNGLRLSVVDIEWGRLSGAITIIF